MSMPYDDFTEAFLYKINEYDILLLEETDRTALIDTYMKKAISAFKKNCLYDLTTTANDELREFDVDVLEEDKDELIDIISDGMIVQWLKPYLYRQELLQNVLNTSDFTTYSPANLIEKLTATYEKAQRDFTQAIREYSFNHGKLDMLHL